MKRIAALMMCAVSLGAAAQIDWDFPYNPDGNNDGYIFSEDLLDLLTVYGQEFNSEELYLSQDSSGLIVFVGDLKAIECLSACRNLNGNWDVMKNKDIVKHYSELALDAILNCDEVQSLGDLVWVQNSYHSSGRPSWETEYAPKLSLMNRHPSPCGGCGTNPPFTSCNQNQSSPSEVGQCWCATQQRPKVEYKVILFDGDDSNMEPLINEAAQEGWRLMPAVNGAGDKATMWRWAE